MRFYSAMLSLFIVAISCRILCAQEKVLEAENPCSRNVLIYFDASGSMFEKRNGGGNYSTNMEYMLDFLEQTIASEELIRDDDVIRISKFIKDVQMFDEISNSSFVITPDNRYEMIESIAVQLNEVRRVNLLPNKSIPPESLKGKSKKEHNDYLNLFEGIKEDVQASPAKDKVVNLVIIYSDFLYDRYGRDYSDISKDRSNQANNLEHENQLRELISGDKDFLASRNYRTVLINQKNIKSDSFGRNERPFYATVIDEFEQQVGAFRIESPEDISSLIMSIQNISRANLAVNNQDSEMSLNEANSISMKLVLYNPNCDDISINNVATGKIVDRGNAANDLPTEAIKEYAGGRVIEMQSYDTVTVTSQQTIDLNDIANSGYAGSRFRIPYVIDITGQNGVQADSGIAELLFMKEGLEYIDVRVSDVFIADHMIGFSDKLFLKLHIAGRILGQYQFKVQSDEPNNLELIEPTEEPVWGPAKTIAKDCWYAFKLSGSGISTDSLLQGKSPISYSVESVGEGPRNTELLGQKKILFKIDPGSRKNYWLWEAISIFIVTIVGAAIRFFFKRQERQFSSF